MFAIPSSHFQTYSPYASSSYGPSLYYPQQRAPRKYRPYTFVDEEEDDDEYQAHLYHKQLEERKRQAAIARAKQQRAQQEEQAYIQAIQRQQAILRQQQEMERAYYEQLRAREAALRAQSIEEDEPEEEITKEEEIAQGTSRPSAQVEEQTTPSSRLSYDQAVEVVQRHARAQLNIRKRMKALSAIRDRLVSAREGFQLSSSLQFDVSKSTSSHPVLSYDAMNRPFRAYEETLLRFLLDVDEVGSAGSERVKKERKALVAEIEEEIGRLDGLKVEEWKKQNDAQEEEKTAEEQ